MLAPESQIVRNADERVRELANTMRAIGPDNCTRPVLLAEGFSDHELDVFGGAARQLATDRFVRTLAKNAASAPLRTDEELIAIALDRCGGLVGEAAIVAHLRGCGFTLETIERLWDRLMPKLGRELARHVGHLPAPAAEAPGKAVA